MKPVFRISLTGNVGGLALRVAKATGGLPISHREAAAPIFREEFQLCSGHQRGL